MPKIDWTKEITKSENENTKRDTRICDLYNSKRKKDYSDQKTGKKDKRNT